MLQGVVYGADMAYMQYLLCFTGMLESKDWVSWGWFAGSWGVGTINNRLLIADN